MQNNTYSPSPITASHDASSKPSILLVLVCLTVVHRLRPQWVSVQLEEAARSEKVNPQRLSRLCSKAIERFEHAVELLTRIGRPTRKTKQRAAAQHSALGDALLDVATALLQHISLRKPAVRSLIIGAYLRLKQRYPELTKKYFCAAIALSERTFRHWMKHPDLRAGGTKVAPPPENKPPKQRPPRRARFGFDVTLPDTQVAADTTDLNAFDVPLKLVAAQDIGRRDQDLLDAIIVDDKESADHVISAITQALGGAAGKQVLTDQGTPYMAQATQAALAQLGAEHAPQKEGDPQGKATIERAFGTVKNIAGPLLALTSQIARAIPALRQPSLAIAAVTLLLTALLKAYQAGARATRRALVARADLTETQIAQLSEQSRQNAVASERSIRFLLTDIHRDYDIKKPLALFIHQMRRFGLEVLKETEKRFSAQVHRDDIRDRASYFAAIARRCNEEHRRRRIIEQQQKEQDQKTERDHRIFEAQMAHWQANPTAWLHDALSAIAQQWIPERKELLFGGLGLGRGWLFSAIDRLIEQNGPLPAADIARAVFRDFQSTDRLQIGAAAMRAMKSILENALEKNEKPKTDCKLTFAATILRNTGPPLRPTP